MNSGLFFTVNYSFSATFIEAFSTQIGAKHLIISLFHDNIKGGNNLFLAWKQIVSSGETKCFQVRNKSETISGRGIDTPLSPT